ncbi:MAG: hypothetical protein EP305_02065 [Bacteroidetes bacterium]|nr:MAG: hypothetical protein EP305_02065 [Bacteroidota bacterium]
MIQIFVEQITERLIYTLDFVFKERGGDYVLNNDPHSFGNFQGPKLNYSSRHFEEVVQLIPASVLFDEEIIVYGIHSGQFESVDCLSFNKNADPLASIFYVMSRMEEYTSTIEDDHGRFESKNSVLHRFGWLQKAMCDRWAVAFLKFLTSRGLYDFKKKKHEVAIIPTFDVDNAFAYQWKDGIRKWMSTARDMISGNRIRMNEREQVLKGVRIDPYDTYDYILSIADRGFEVKMFWLLGDYAKYDKNISFKDVRHQRLIRNMASKVTVGIHPSYKSNSYEYYLLNEKERLENILHKTVENSRQHFLKMKISKTYPVLKTMGIKHEYTMGYADNVGFRAGTARPHRWFDLNKNAITNLIVHPFSYMDGTLNEYLNLSIEESKEKIYNLFSEIDEFGGDFIFIWHNETIGNYGKWEGWKEVLEHSLSLKNKS